MFARVEPSSPRLLFNNLYIYINQALDWQVGQLREICAPHGYRTTVHGIPCFNQSSHCPPCLCVFTLSSVFVCERACMYAHMCVCVHGDTYEGVFEDRCRNREEMSWSLKDVQLHKYSFFTSLITNYDKLFISLFLFFHLFFRVLKFWRTAFSMFCEKYI